MLEQVYQSGFISLLYSVGCDRGSIRRVLDEDVQSSVVELLAGNIAHTWLRIPFGAHEQQQESLLASALHIRLRHLILVLKNLDQHVSLEVHVADDRNIRRRFRFSTFQKSSAVHSQLALLPLHLDSGWNQLHLDLGELSRTCYNARYAHAISQMFSEAQLPAEFRLFRRLNKRDQYRISNKASKFS
ncbi:uncharacterized protein PITG_18413 [Phytophthora infestans T30-4]|uniref:CFA20 domain-containing protein n=1 Tax=Phytophthora infestans (strain T30-4) TaxID=403677 RepID=D0NWZ1_PHYIT|nr:uncharacterized protein PITG_18413 [Phytophthora infestans T30-4]EEY67583.1 conserved hypothetical protein [Phytophthora infestans T30-4]|eukprot:XP_002896348.1 conserved hypothetical protein [Phytophthora infestans T30-4]